MSKYFSNMYDTVNTLWTGMRITFRHMMNIRKDNVTLQYPEERWPRPERNIGFNHEDYNVIRSRLHGDIDDCIGCYRCERVCPVDCIKIETIKSERGEDIPNVKHTGVTSNGTKKGFVVNRFTIDMSECCYCNLCTYPCPEECIFMVGGPNSSKHPIDYEFSEVDRKDLIYEFSKKLTPKQKDSLTKVDTKAEA